jgi:Fe-S cluster biogenesis protein NfuA
VLDSAQSLGPSVAEVVAELSAMLGGDGGSLELIAVDETSGAVSLRLDLDGVPCSDCVLPPDRLRDVVDTRLRSAVPTLGPLMLDDPRVASAAVSTTVAAQTISVLDPTAGAVPGDDDPGPDLGPLAGKRIGLRIDVLWAAYDQTVSEWIPELQRAGAIVTTWRRAQGLKGRDGERHQAEYDAFVGGVDAIVSGLANCGSCTSWSVRDGLNALNRGLPTVVAVTEHFVGLARTLAADSGRPGLRLLQLDSSLNVLPEDQVRAAARDAFPRLLDALGAVV